MNIFHDTLAAMPDKAWTLNRGPKPDPCVPLPKTPAGEVQADVPGPAIADGTTSAGPVAGPGEAPESPAPGVPLEETPQATPRASDEHPEETQGAAEDGSEGEAAPGDVVTQAEVEAEFGPVRTESEPGQ